MRRVLTALHRHCACHSSDRLRRGIAVFDPEQLLQLAKLVPELRIVLIIA
jgi:hypothetical protein